MIYHHKDNGHPVNAIQLTGPESAERIRREFHCPVECRPDDAMAIVDGVPVERGQYAVLAMPAIVAVEQELFDRRYRKFEVEMDLFEKIAGA